VYLILHVFLFFKFPWLFHLYTYGKFKITIHFHDFRNYAAPDGKLKHDITLVIFVLNQQKKILHNSVLVFACWQFPSLQFQDFPISNTHKNTRYSGIYDFAIGGTGAPWDKFWFLFFFSKTQLSKSFKCITHYKADLLQWINTILIFSSCIIKLGKLLM